MTTCSLFQKGIFVILCEITENSYERYSRFSFHSHGVVKRNVPGRKNKTHTKAAYLRILSRPFITLVCNFPGKTKQTQKRLIYEY